MILWNICVYSQATIALQNFETSGSNYNYINTNGILQSGNSSSSDRPASSAFYVSTNTGFRATNTTATLNFNNVNGLKAYSSKKIALRLAAFSINSASNGMDATDKVTISVSLNGGSSFSDELIVKGLSNAYWHYTTGTGVAAVNYDGNNIATEFAPTGGGSRTADGYSTLIVNLPDSCSQVKLKIVMSDDSNNEAWLIDDVKLKGCILPNVTCPPDSTVCLNSGLIPLTGGNPVGGNYSGAGVSNNKFDPVIAGTGIHLITFTYSDANGCSNNCTFQFSVISTAIHNVQTNSDYCSLQSAIAAAENSNTDELQISAGNYLGSCIEIAKDIKLTPLVFGIEIPCLKMKLTGKFIILGGDLIINQLTLSGGKIRTNGHKLICGSISGGNANSYIITD